LKHCNTTRRNTRQHTATHCTIQAREPMIVNGPEILDKFVGEAEKKIRALFAPSEAEWKAAGDASALHVIGRLRVAAVRCSVLWCVAVCCGGVLQCVAVCCSVLQCVAVRCSVLQCVAVCFSALQCVAVCYSVLQCVAVCCSVMQYIAVCCGVLQCVAVESFRRSVGAACHVLYFTHNKIISDFMQSNFY